MSSWNTLENWNIFLDLQYLYTLPIISIIAAILNFLSAFIFARHQFRQNKIYNFLIANSIIDGILLLSIAIYSLSKCQNLCDWTKSSIVGFFESTYRIYIGRSLKFLSVLMSVTITFYRYSSLRGHNWVSKKISLKIIIIFLSVLSLIFFVPTLYINRGFILVNLPGLGSSFNQSSPFQNAISSKLALNKFIVSVIIYTANIVTLLIMVVLNSMLIYHLKTKMKQKEINFSSIGTYQSLLATEGKENDTLIKIGKVRLKAQGKKLTLMIIFLSIVFFIDYILITTAYTISTLFIKSSIMIRVLFLAIYFVEIICFCSNIFIYYHFNNLFAYKFKMFFKNLYFFCVLLNMDL
jgi:hypothetical protein